MVVAGATRRPREAPLRISSHEEATDLADHVPGESAVLRGKQALELVEAGPDGLVEEMPAVPRSVRVGGTAPRDARPATCENQGVPV